MPKGLRVRVSPLLPSVGGEIGKRGVLKRRLSKDLRVRLPPDTPRKIGRVDDGTSLENWNLKGSKVRILHLPPKYVGVSLEAKWLPVKEQKWGQYPYVTPIMPCPLMVGERTLNPLIEVRVLARQPKIMSRKQFRFRNRTLKRRSQKNKPVWLWKWTAEADQKYRRNRWKYGRVADGATLLK